MSLITEIRLEKYSWTSGNNIYVTGFVWLNGLYTIGKAFVELILQNTGSFEYLKRKAKQWNGQFSFVVEKENEIWAGCSHSWSFPLFYRTLNEKVFLSDEPRNLLVNNSTFEIDPFAESYFLNFGVTPAEHTLSKDVFQLQPGELISISEKNVSKYSCLPFSKGIFSNEQSAKEDELYKYLLLGFEKYYNTVKDKKVLLPLTRGYDSRLLACLLKEYGHKNVICVTWGRPLNSELETAQRVAGTLEFRHIFVDYSKIVLNDFTLSNEFQSYVNFAGHLSSMPFLYEYFGLKDLKEKKIIDNDTVALPGHPGDFLRGSHLFTDMPNIDYKLLVSHILVKFGTTFPLKRSAVEKIEKYIGNEFFAKKETPLWRKYEYWDFNERQCKFIGNSTQAYEFFGIDYLMPLFDTDLIKFFNKLPFEQKVEEELYNNTLEIHFFKKFGVDFDLKERSQSGRKIFKLKDKLLRVIPGFFKKYYYPMDDDIYYREITNILQSSNKAFQFKHPIRPNAYNSYITQWYLQFLRNSI